MIHCAIAAHKAAYAELAAISDEKAPYTKAYDERMDSAMKRCDAALKTLLNTMPQTVLGAASALMHLGQCQWADPDQPNILIGAEDAGDPGLKAAAEQYPQLLGAALFGIGAASREAARA